MVPAALLKDKFWLLLAVVFLVGEWSTPVVAQSLDAESHVVFSFLFALAWTVFVAALGLLFYLQARDKPQLASVAMVLALATLSLLYRAPTMFVEPQFTAEDGHIFYIQQREWGLSAFLVPYNGYYHATVRLAAALMAPVPTLFAPAFYNLAWLALYSLLVAYLLVQYPDKKWAPVIALVTAFISHTCEVFMVVTDTIWLGGLALTVFVLLPIPQVRAGGRYLFAGLLLLFSVSGPFSLICSPFYLLRWIASRGTFPFVYVAAVIMGAAVQMSALHSYYADKHPGLPLNWDSFITCLQIMVLRLPWSLAVGYQPYEGYWWIGLFALLVLLAFAAYEIKLDPKKHLFPLGCFLFCAIYITLDFVRIYPLAALFPLVNGDRYFFIPKVLFVWALIHLVATARNPKPFCIALLLCAMGSMVEYTSSQIIVDNHWPHYATMIDQGKTIPVPINPPHWHIIFSGTETPPSH